ncbi:MAG: hypothetical protein PHO93_02310 [Candidatus Saccharimonadaceae bacterium]|nr:hypothetical protein [Candidatus Saccharimonadaceae bacterium]
MNWSRRFKYSRKLEKTNIFMGNTRIKTRGSPQDSLAKSLTSGYLANIVKKALPVTAKEFLTHTRLLSEACVSICEECIFSLIVDNQIIAATGNCFYEDIANIDELTYVEFRKLFNKLRFNRESSITLKIRPKFMNGKTGIWIAEVKWKATNPREIIIYARQHSAITDNNQQPLVSELLKKIPVTNPFYNVWLKPGASFA